MAVALDPDPRIATAAGGSQESIINREVNMVMGSRKKGVAACVAVMSALLLAGAAGAAERNDKLYGMLPDAIKQSGAVSVGTDPQNPPYVQYDGDNKTVVGLEQDLFDEMSGRLGIKFDIVPAARVGIIPGVQSARYDMAGGAYGDFPAREEVVDVVDYAVEAVGLIVLDGNAKNITKLKETCGNKVAGQQGTLNMQILEKQRDACPSDKPLEILQFPSADQVLLAVRSGRADAALGNIGSTVFTLDHQSTTDAKLALVGPRYGTGYQGFLVGKNNPELRDAIIATLQSMIDDGTYGEIFAKWKVSDNSITKIVYNDGAKYGDRKDLD